MAEDAIRGRYCYTFGENEDIKEARILTHMLAVRNAVESSRPFKEAFQVEGDWRWTRDVIQVLQSGYLKDLKVVDHKEEGRKICETVEAAISPDDFRKVLEREREKRKKRLEDEALGNNGFLKILDVQKVEGDRYGKRISVVVKVLRRTGSLYRASERNQKPRFKVCLDYFGVQGTPLGGDAAFIHESEDEMLPGEIKTLDFYVPSKADSYKVWLVEPAGKRAERPAVAMKKASSPRSKTTVGMKGDRSLKGIERESREDALALRVLSDEPIRLYRNFFMSSPPRLVIDLPGRWGNPKDTVFPLTDQMVRRLRVGKHADKLRLVIDMQEGAPMPAATLSEDAEGLLIILKREQ